MGNDLDSSFRGEVNVELTAVVNSLSDDGFKKFMEEAEAAGVLDSSEYPDQATFIAGLAELDEGMKKDVMANLKAGKAPFGE